MRFGLAALVAEVTLSSFVAREAGAAPPKAAILEVQGGADAATLEWMTQKWRADSKAVTRYEWVTPQVTLPDLLLVLDCAELDESCLATIGQNLGVAVVFAATVSGGKAVFQSVDASAGRQASRDEASLSGSDEAFVGAFAAAGVRFVKGEKAAATGVPPPLAKFPAVAAQGKLRVKAQPEGVEVRVDGVGRGRAPVEIGALVAGEHTVEGRLQGYGKQAHKVKIEAGTTAEVSIVLQREGGAPPPVAVAPKAAVPPVAVAAASPPRSEAQASSSRAPLLGRIRWPTWATSGATAALLVTGIVLGVSANSAESDLDDPSRDCASADEYDRCRDLEDTARGRALAANVVLGLAGAAAVATGVLFYLDLRAGEASAALGATF
ncbi:MAG: PEGA domain-containing protein [Myxococcota bacterium]|mgnify:CR=1 FL=1